MSTLPRGRNGVTTQFYLTDALGSVVSTFDDTVGSAAILGNQAYGPYGNKIYSAGSMGTNKGYTGQYQDATGLDYYNARYYDAVIGRFVSADSVQGNTKGMDPYDYVGGNPETRTDPTGHHWATIGEGGDSVVHNEPFDPTPSCARTGSCSVTCVPGVNAGCAGPYIPQLGPYYPHGKLPDGRSPAAGRAPGAGPPAAPAAAQSPSASSDTLQKLIDHLTLAVSLVEIIPSTAATVETGDADVLSANVDEIDASWERVVSDDTETAADPCVGGAFSFTYLTTVGTTQGKQAIGGLKPGEKVWAHNQQTKKMELEPIMHVWINHDNDLEDLTLVTNVPAKKGKAAQQVYETIHTTQKHPFLTQEYGFLPVSALHIGMHIVKADGTVGEVFAWTLVPGANVMYNLEVQQDHTFTVGNGLWVVHNDDCGLTGPASRHYYSSVSPKSASKDINTIILPGYYKDVAADLEEINSGGVTPNAGTYTVNGRTYGTHNGSLVPISGDGFITLDRGGYQALKIYRQQGFSDRTEWVLDQMKINSSQRQDARAVYDAANP